MTNTADHPRAWVEASRASAPKALPEAMRAETRLLSTALGTVITEADGEELFGLIEELRALTIEAVEDAAGDALTRAEQLVDSLDADAAQRVARGFTVYFLLVNLAEERQRVRALRVRQGIVPLHEQHPGDSLAATVRALSAEVGAEEAERRLGALRFHPVLTAHPTEARRRAVSQALERIGAILDERADARFGPMHRIEADHELLDQIDILWRTAQLRTTAPKPQDEVRTALRVVDSSLLDTVLATYRRLEDALREAGHPLEVPAFVRLGTWIGGDRDGNGNVTAQVTRDATAMAADLALTRHARAARDIAWELTVDDGDTPPSDALRGLIAAMRTTSEDAYAEAATASPRETHRIALLLIAERLEATRLRQADLGYADPEEAVADLRIVRDSLVAAGARRAAHGPLRRLIWALQTFGFHLAELEVRQHSKVHRAALAWLRDPAGREERPAPPVDPEEVLATFRAISWARKRYGARAAGRYIISFTTSSQDVADIFALAREAGLGGDGTPDIDVVPLFETHEDLRNAPRVLAEMVELPEVRDRLAARGNRLEIMLGYSDSSKDVGPVAATIALADAQREIAAWSRETGVAVTMFHGRGGSLGRGGGPAHRAIMAQPAGSVDLRFKVTEQGEVINARYADREIGARHIEQVASAALLSSAPSNEARDEAADRRFAELRRTLSDASRARFHDLVHAEGFAPWFAQVTPQEEIGMLSLGSRPARRGLSMESLDDLRAIPWNFAWSQARSNLTAWFGLGTAFESVGDVDLLRSAYQDWPLLTTLVDNVEMSLAKSDPRIARRYLELGDRPELAQLVLEEMELTSHWVREVTGHAYLLESHPILGRAVQLRNPYVDALSLLQLRALRRLRSDGTGAAGPTGGAGATDTRDARDARDTEEQARHLMLLTLKGVAAGLQNTG